MSSHQHTHTRERESETHILWILLYKYIQVCKYYRKKRRKKELKGCREIERERSLLLKKPVNIFFTKSIIHTTIYKSTKGYVIFYLF